ncbi:MAG: c-type cytochrome, partial [Dinghuibacter sp.]|nr:c-type cytochrome [Dinghuibacter sp.]
ASCHKPEFAFADTSAFSLGIKGQRTKRNTPSVLNMLNRLSFFWDGRAKTLEQQALMPIANKEEMGLPIPEAVKRLNQHPEYKKLFRQVFKQAPNAANLAAALAAYERTLETVESKFDDWSNDDTANWTASEERGRLLFLGDKAKCFDCHFMEDFTGDEFRNIGLYTGAPGEDAGRFSISRNKKEAGAFKTPGLRNVAVTAPYMHDGRFKTLEEVVAYYNDPRKVVPHAVNTDPLLQKPLGLTAQEMTDLVAFLKTLTDREFLKPR